MAQMLLEDLMLKVLLVASFVVKLSMSREEAMCLVVSSSLSLAQDTTKLSTLAV